MAKQNGVEAIRYEFREGARAPKGLAPEVVGQELERIRESNEGQLMPERVVDESRPATAPLHPAFEWNNKTAAESWRVHQARNLIRSVRIVKESGESHPAYYHVKIDHAPKPYYQSAKQIAERPDEFAAAVRELRSKFEQANSALEALRRLAESDQQPKASNLAVISAIAEGLQAVRSMAERLH